MTYENPFAVVTPADAVNPLAAFTTMLITTRVGIDPVTGNIWQFQGARGMVNVATIPAPPVNTVAPVLSGTGVHGTALTVTAGTWNPTGTIGPYSWYSGANLVSQGNSFTSYTPAVSDIGNMITCVVTCSNQGGAPTATSNAIGPIT